MIDTLYYQSRLEAELEAADRADDPSIAQIHRDMADRYHELLDGDAGAPQPALRPPPQPGTMIGQPRA